MSKITVEQLSELHEQNKAGRVTRENLQAFLRNPDSVNGLGFTVTVDYSKPLPEMIATGRYDWTNSDITSGHFPAKGSGVAELKLELVHLGKAASTDEVLRYLDEQGYRPATLPELLAFGAKFPEEQRKYPVVALASVWRRSDGSRDVPYLYRDDAGRNLSLHWSGDGWDGGYRFLAVRK